MNNRKLNWIKVHKDLVSNYGFCIFEDKSRVWWLDIMFGVRTLSIRLSR